jgi:AraC-like DNA-binding protein
MILEGLREREIFTGNIPFRIAVNTEQNFDYPSHWHNAVELIYAAKDNCTVNVNKSCYELCERDILIVAPGDIHSFHINNSRGVRYFIQFDLSKLLSFSSNDSYKAYQYHTEMVSAKDNSILHNVLEDHLNKIINEYRNMDFAFDLFINARFLDITVILYRSLFKNNTTVKLNNKTYELSKLDKAFEYIEDNYHKPITLADIAKAAGFSEYHFSRVFKKATEKNLHNYLNEYRVKKAEALLFTEVSITEIAYASGFNSIVTFNRIFKQVKGCSPSEYIKKLV